MKLHEALKPFIQLVHFSAKLVEAPYALVGHLVEEKYITLHEFVCSVCKSAQLAC